MALSISEAASLAGLSTHSLRYYERVGLLPFVSRGSDGHRRYLPADVEWIRLITNLRSTGMPIRDVRRFVDVVVSDGPPGDRIAVLAEHRDSTMAKLAEATRQLEAVEAKLDYFLGRSHTCYVDAEEDVAS